MTTGRNTITIYDYPEHLNPFYEEDPHNRLHFTENLKKKTRSNSFSFQYIKDLRHTLSFRKNNKITKNAETSSRPDFRDNGGYSSSTNTASYGQTLPRPLTERYVYKNSVTPLPRLRFHERVKQIEQNSNNHVDQESISSVELRKPIISVSNNPFSDEQDESLHEIIEPRPTSSLSLESPSSVQPHCIPRRKKRAPAPPPPLPRSTSIRLSPNTAQNSVLHTSLTADDNNQQVEPKETFEINFHTEVSISTSEHALGAMPSKSEASLNEQNVEVIEDVQNVNVAIEHNTDVTIGKNLDADIQQNANTAMGQIVDAGIEQRVNVIDYAENFDVVNEQNADVAILQYSDAVNKKTDDNNEDFLEKIKKLTKEVEKMTFNDDRNNNVIDQNSESKYVFDLASDGFDICPRPARRGRHTAEMSLVLDSPNGESSPCSSDGTVSSNPESAKLVRIRKDDAWIKGLLITDNNY